MLDNSSKGWTNFYADQGLICSKHFRGFAHTHTHFHIQNTHANIHTQMQKHYYKINRQISINQIKNIFHISLLFQNNFEICSKGKV